MKRHYTEALLAAIRAGVAIDVALDNFRASLIQRHHEKLYIPVLRAALRRLAHEAVHAGATVVVARAADAGLPSVAQSLSALGAQEQPQVIVDETIIGGAVVSYKHRSIDGSYKAALTKLYQAITK